MPRGLRKPRAMAKMPGKNRRGMYEYVLSKMVMLIFVLGLTGIFYGFYTSQLCASAEEIAQSEATRLMNEIDGVVNNYYSEGSITVNLKHYLKVGPNDEQYSLMINYAGVVAVTIDKPLCGESRGIATFGLDLHRITGTDKIDCSPDQLRDGAQIKVSTFIDNIYVTDAAKFYRVVRVEMDASESCGDYMVFERAYED